MISIMKTNKQNAHCTVCTVTVGLYNTEGRGVVMF